MPRPWRIRFSGAKYHVTQRGNARKAIFRKDEDRQRFLEQLQEALDLDEVRLFAYVLMPNHYHLVVETPLGNIQRFMQRLNTAYGMYFRFKHSEPGHCFQGRYGAKLVKGDDYLVRVIRYVHLNPVKGESWKGVSAARKRAVLAAYSWSSYPGYMDKARAEEYVDYRWLKLMGRKTLAGNRRAYKAYVESMVSGSDQVLEEALGKAQYAIGDDRFRDEVETELKEARLKRGVYGGDIAWPERKKVSLSRIEELVCKAYRATAEDLHGRSRSLREARSVFAELASRLSGQSQRDIGEYLGYTSVGTAGKMRQVLRKKIQQDAELLARLEQLTAKLQA